MKFTFVLAVALLMSVSSSALASPAPKDDRADALLGTYSGVNANGDTCSMTFGVNPYHPGEIDLTATPGDLILEFDVRAEVDQQLARETSSLAFHHDRASMYDCTNDIAISLDSKTGLPLAVTATQSGLGGVTHFDCRFKKKNHFPANCARSTEDST